MPFSEIVIYSKRHTNGEYHMTALLTKLPAFARFHWMTSAMNDKVECFNPSRSAYLMALLTLSRQW